jgi:hypothetical protein
VRRRTAACGVSHHARPCRRRRYLLSAFAFAPRRPTALFLLLHASQLVDNTLKTAMASGITFEMSVDPSEFLNVDRYRSHSPHEYDDPSIAPWMDEPVSVYI